MNAAPVRDPAPMRLHCAGGAGAGNYPAGNAAPAGVFLSATSRLGCLLPPPFGPYRGGVGDRVTCLPSSQGDPGVAHAAPGFRVFGRHVSGGAVQ